MMFKYELLSNTAFEINNKIVDTIFVSIHNTIDKKQKGSINIVFLDEDSIKILNNKYRGKNSSTDVLSFHYYDDFSKLQDYDIAGEIIMSEKKIIEQGIEYGLGSEKEFYKLLIHSLLHILGFDHELEKEYKIMQKYEDLIWESIFGKNEKND